MSEEWREGQRVYRVVWAEGQPAIEAGRLVLHSGKRKVFHVHFPGGTSATLREWSATMKEAIEQEIIWFAKKCAPDGIFNKGKPLPWALTQSLAKLNRLYRKLQRHHLA